MVLHSFYGKNVLTEAFAYSQSLRIPECIFCQTSVSPLYDGYSMTYCPVVASSGFWSDLSITSFPLTVTSTPAGATMAPSE